VLNGCRGGGIFLYRCQDVAITDCTVHGYQGDGISFQTSHDVRVERCRCTGNAGLGIHPGSGSQRPVVLDCQSVGNGRIGLFVCWRVKGGQFARLLLRDNGQDGLSIGHKDTDNQFEDITSEGNARYGIHFRDEPAALAAHRNQFLHTHLAGNGRAAIRVDGTTSGLRFEELEIAAAISPDQAAWEAIQVGPDASKPEVVGLRLVGATPLPERGPESVAQTRARTAEQAIAQAQAIVRRHVPDGRSLADDLIVERRAEAERD
jgi:hypothetical protein